MSDQAGRLLSVHGLTVSYATGGGELRAVDGLDLELSAHECLGIVGESGSGKTQLLLALLGLNQPAARLRGSVRYRGEELLGAAQSRLAQLRGRRLSIVFQEPMRALNPYLSIATQLTEGVRRHLGLGRRAAVARASELLAMVQINAPAQRLRQYPHELSGGIRQRVMIAMALMCEPEILLLDEPTTALDVTVQAQLLELLRGIRERTGVAILFVTHDLGCLAEIADRVAVMYAGRMIESAAAAELYAAPRHPYTSGLLRSLPRLDQPLDQALAAIPGQTPDLAALPAGCAYAPRCPSRFAACADRPRWRWISATRQLACHLDDPEPRDAGVCS